MTQRFVSPLIQIFHPTTGDVVPGATMTFFETGTSTPKDIYSDDNYDTTQPNPITSDNAGRFFDNIFLDTSDGLYRVVCKDGSGNTLWTKDDVGNTTARTDIVGAKSGAIWYFVGSQRDLQRHLLSGWKVCDGSGGTPDMVGRFSKGQASPVGTGGPGGDSIPQPTGSISSHAITISEMPQHQHDSGGVIRALNDGSFSGGFINRSGGSGALIPFKYITNAHGGGQGHTHDTNINEIDITPKYTYAIPLIYLGS